MRHHRILEVGLTMCVGLIATGAAWAAPAHADQSDLQLLCPFLLQTGSKLARAASDLTNGTSDITGKQGPQSDTADMFTQSALSNYCPDAMSSLTKGQLPNIPFVISDRPDVQGIFGGIPNPSGPFAGLPGVLGGAPGVPGQ